MPTLHKHTHHTHTHSDKPSRSYSSAICGTIKRKDPMPMMTDPKATIRGLWSRAPMKLTNKTTARAPKSWELATTEDLVEEMPKCFSMAGRPALAIPFTAKPSRKHMRKTQKTNRYILFKDCKTLKPTLIYH